MKNLLVKSKRRQRNAVKKFHTMKHHPFVIPVITFMVLFFVSLIGYVNLGARTVGASDKLVVNLSIDGEEQVLPTRARTVGELLERLDIKLEEKDIVRPSQEVEIDQDNFKVEIYHARPVLVEAGDKKNVTYTAEPELNDVAKSAGFEVHPEDKLITEPLGTIDREDILRQGVVAEKVVIKKAKQVYLSLYGTSIPLKTHSETVAQLLAEKNIVLEDDDVLQPDVNSAIAENSQVFVIRVGTHVATEDIVIPREEEIIDDPNLPKGTTRVEQEGANGRKIVTYEVEVQNGQEVSRRLIQEIIASEPIKRVVVRGTKVIISNPSANVELGRKIAADMGWGHQFSCIYEIFQRESKWNHLARNRSSGAYGIPQALPGSKMGPGWESDPAVQIRWGIGYMAKRYGSPCAANNFWQINHWY